MQANPLKNPQPSIIQLITQAITENILESSVNQRLKGDLEFWKNLQSYTVSQFESTYKIQIKALEIMIVNQKDVLKTITITNPLVNNVEYLESFLNEVLYKKQNLNNDKNRKSANHNTSIQRQAANKNQIDDKASVRAKVMTHIQILTKHNKQIEDLCKKIPDDVDTNTVLLAIHTQGNLEFVINKLQENEDLYSHYIKDIFYKNVDISLDSLNKELATIKTCIEIEPKNPQNIKPNIPDGMFNVLKRFIGTEQQKPNSEKLRNLHVSNKPKELSNDLIDFDQKEEQQIRLAIPSAQQGNTLKQDPIKKESVADINTDPVLKFFLDLKANNALSIYETNFLDKYKANQVMLARLKSVRDSMNNLESLKKSIDSITISNLNANENEYDYIAATIKTVLVLENIQNASKLKITPNPNETLKNYFNELVNKNFPDKFIEKFLKFIQLTEEEKSIFTAILKFRNQHKNLLSIPTLPLSDDIKNICNGIKKITELNLLNELLTINIESEENNNKNKILILQCIDILSKENLAQASTCKAFLDKKYSLNEDALKILQYYSGCEELQFKKFIKEKINNIHHLKNLIKIIRNFQYPTLEKDSMIRFLNDVFCNNNEHETQIINILGNANMQDKNEIILKELFKKVISNIYKDNISDLYRPYIKDINIIYKMQNECAFPNNDKYATRVRQLQNIAMNANMSDIFDKDLKFINTTCADLINKRYLTLCPEGIGGLDANQSELLKQNMNQIILEIEKFRLKAIDSLITSNSLDQFHRDLELKKLARESFKHRDTWRYWLDLNIRVFNIKLNILVPIIRLIYMLLHSIIAALPIIGKKDFIQHSKCNTLFFSSERTGRENLFLDAISSHRKHN